jgi:ADP-ribosylation factor GTPase-activating protein 1
MCLECSGRHRGLGVHVSFVRSGILLSSFAWTNLGFKSTFCVKSVSMDSWTEKQIKLMKGGGNDCFNEFLESYGVRRNTPIAQKYNSPAALLYKERYVLFAGRPVVTAGLFFDVDSCDVVVVNCRLLAAIEGRPLPTELPKVEAGSGPSQAALQGTDPLPGESEADYVARQRRLQAEAKERLRQKFGASSGLSSNGAMQGIGSDASYRPGQPNEGIADKAASMWSMLGDTVSKSITEENQQQVKAAAAKGWAAAVDLWTK